MKNLIHSCWIGLCVLFLASPAAPALLVESRNAPDNWVFVVAVESAFPSHLTPAGALADRLIDTLISKYGYEESNIRLVSGEFATANVVYKELLSLASRMSSGDSAAVFLFTDVLFDPKLGPLVVTSEGVQYRERLVPVNAIPEALQKSALSDVFIFFEACLDDTQTKASQYSSRAPIRSYPRATLYDASVLYGCPWQITRDPRTLSSVFIDELAQNENPVLTLQDIYLSLSDKLGQYDVHLQQGRTAQPFQFVVSATTLDESALRVLNETGKSYDDRIAALRTLYASALSEYRRGNNAPLISLSGTLVALAQRPEDDLDLKMTAVKVLSAYPGELAETGLLAVVRENSPADNLVKETALDILGQIGSDAAIAAVVNHISHTNERLRQAALHIVEESALVEAVAAIIAQIQREDIANLKYRELEVLQSLAEDAEFSVENMDVLHAIATTDTEEEFVRSQAIATIGAIGNSESLSTIAEVAKAALSISVREIAVYTLARLDTNPATHDFVVELLIDTLDDSSEFVVSAAAYSLGELKIEQATDELIELLSDRHSSVDVKITAAEAVGRIGSSDAVPPLRRALNADDQILRLTAIQALEQIGTTDAAEAIVRAFADDNDYVRAAALNSYRSINPEDSDISRALRDAVRSAQDPEVKALYLERLSIVQDDAIVDVLIDSLYDTNVIVVQTATRGLATTEYRDRVVSKLRRLADNDKVQEQVIAIRALAAIDDPDATAVLTDKLNTDTAFVLEEAIKALGQHTNEVAIAALRPIAEGYGRPSVAALDALSNIGTSLYTADEFDQAMDLVHEVIRLREANHDRMDPALALDYNNLAAMQQKLGNLDEAEELLLKAVSIQTAHGYEGEPATSLSNLGYLYVEKGDREISITNNRVSANDYYADAESAFIAALNIREAMVGPYNPEVAAVYDSLALVNEKMGLESAARDYRERAEIVRRTEKRPKPPTIL